MAVKHGAGAFTGMMMRVRCVYCIKIRSWGGVTDPKVSSAIMVGHWATKLQQASVSTACFWTP